MKTFTVAMAVAMMALLAMPAHAQAKAAQGGDQEDRGEEAGR